MNGISIKDEFLAQFSCTPPDGTPPELLESYRFISLLSEKSSRSVFLLQHRESGEKAVLKAALPDDPEDTAREYRIQSELDHPGIPRALAYHVSAKGRFLLRAYAEGETLEYLLERDGRFPEKRALEILLSLCDILEYLHGRRPPVIFRDIQPRNIVLTPNGKLSLIDFGISKDAADEAGQGTVLIGTRYFAAPENFGFSAAGPQTDIYALGCLLMWLCSGEADVKNCRRLGLSGPVCRMIEKCTQLSPRRRYKSAASLKRHIIRLLEPPKHWEIALSLGMAALVAAGGIWLWQDRPASDDAVSDPQAPIRASETAYEKEASFPVTVRALYSGEPCADAVVALDNRHWYYPAQDGEATLLGYAYDQYMLKACLGNRTAQQLISVNRSMEKLSFELDIALTPEQPEYFEIKAASGEYTELEFPSTRADTVSMQAELSGIEEIERDGRVYLAVQPGAEPGHYSFFVEGSNGYGFATTQVSVFVEEHKEAVPIYDAPGLLAMRENLGGSYVLMADIDLADLSAWEPVGSAEQPFTGLLDGNGYRISGLTVNSESGSAGLFGYAENAVLRNVLLMEPEIKASYDGYGNVGALAAVLRDCFVDSCAVFGGSVTAQMGNQSNIGGLAGYIGGTIRGCFSSARVEVSSPEEGDGQSYAGGLCGVLLGYITGSGNTGAVKGPYVAGGLVGMNDNSVISSSYNAGMVDGGLVTGIMPPGGISHIIRLGRYHSHCAYLSGTASQATSVTTNGYPYAMSVLTEADFHASALFCRSLDVEEDAFVWGSEYSGYPIPSGIFKVSES